MKKIDEILKTKGFKPDRRNAYEFQAYGNRLAEELGDLRHRALYIKLAKTEERSLLEQARDHCKASHGAVTKGRLFMWKLKQLKELKSAKEDKTGLKPGNK